VSTTLRTDLKARAGGRPAASDDEAVTNIRPLPPVVARRCPTCQQPFSGGARFCPFDGETLVAAPDWNPASDPLIGTVIDGRYIVVSVLGEGGMGTVYEVRHTVLDRRFALKVLRREVADAEATARFIQEAKAAAAIGHENIVAVSDYGELTLPGGARGPYFVMELLGGKTLATVLRDEGPLGAERVAGIFIQCAKGLAAAHSAGVIHRDVKPDNIVITRRPGDPDDGADFVKLLDFGVAKMAGTSKLTRAGIVFGTPHYMSPEQAAGKTIDHRADIYALGVILYECFAGRVPFEADSYMSVLTKHQFAVPDPIERVVPDPSRLGALGPVVMRCLQKDPQDRFATMTDVAAALELAIKDPVRAASESVAPPRPSGELHLRSTIRMDAGRVSLPSLAAVGIRPVFGRAALGVVGVLALVAVAVGVLRWRSSSSPLGAGAEAATAQTPAPPKVAATSAPAAATAAPSTPPLSSTAAAALPAVTSIATTAPAAVAPPTPQKSGPGRSGGTVAGPTRPPRAQQQGDVIDPWH
jgi:eukaryotic-like serine/threonine-protein kinase